MDYPIIWGSALGGLVLGALVGYWLRIRQAAGRLESHERRAQQVIADAQREAEAVKRTAVLDGKEEALRMKQAVEREVQRGRSDLLAAERAFQEKETSFSRRVEVVDKKEREVQRRETDLHKRETEVRERDQQLQGLMREQTSRLERIAGMSADEARGQLIAALETEARAEASRLVTDIREEAQRGAEQESRRIVTLAIQRYAGDHVSESTVSVVHLPSDEMKGRIIGREGRNIRSFETITGVDVIIDDTPEAVILSCFDPVRREVARQALEKLVADGRIHPARIEEIVDKTRKEIEEKIRQFGEQACLEVGIHGIHPELQNLLGRLQYRTSYGQNVLRHSIEVAHLAGIMAAELGFDVATAKRGGLLHDIGKAIDHDQEGTHAGLGMEVAAKYGEAKPILEAIGYHHDDFAGGSLWPVLVAAADAISGARPGARRESLETYVRRLEKLEKIANEFPGVDKSFAIQAGREIRIMVEQKQVDDTGARGLAHDVARRIEKELDYPGQIRVTVIRETRAVDYAK